MKNLFFTLFLFSNLIIISGCDDDSTTSFGEPCDENSVCEGVCNLGLPEGMCTEVCSDTQPCSKGLCVEFNADESYCMPQCEDNENCREGYSCIDYFCAPKQGAGSRCDDNADCLDCTEDENCPDGLTQECRENVCSYECTDQDQCPDGTVCALSGTSYWCVGIYFQQGDGTAGESCAVSDCSSGFSCITDFERADPTPFCSNECIDSRECPPDMVCRPYGSNTKSWCIPRAYCEGCDMDFQCGYDQDACLNYGDVNGSFCSSQCDEAVPTSCGPDSTCSEVFFCPDRGQHVLDCENECPEGCALTTASIYQCVKSYGSCVGGGEECSPCEYDEQCNDGSECVFSSLTGNRVCAISCENFSDCGDTMICTELSDGTKYCLPRTGECSNPSGELGTCQICSENADCMNGACLTLPGDTTGFSYCLDFCDGGASCDGYSECTSLDMGGVSVDVCVMTTAVESCVNYLECLDICPTGPGECTDGPSYCQ
ncbi:MAG: hypothetical protein JXR95_09800 [Deltaproteobacteria bacterium]|nr:hypothetical protein [Deltaproteobacteria bacterium]